MALCHLAPSKSHNLLSLGPLQNAEARTTAGRSFNDERSEKGNLTSTTELPEGETMLPPPLAGSSLLKELLHLKGLFQR